VKELSLTIPTIRLLEVFRIRLISAAAVRATSGASLVRDADASWSRPYLGCESRSATAPPHWHVPTVVIHTRRVKGAYAGRGTPEYLYPLRPLSCRLRPSSFGADERGSLSPDRPPMGVVPSSNRDYGLRRGRCSPRAPRTRILYLPEKSRARLGAHVCAPTVCPERIASLPATGAHYCAPCAGDDAIANKRPRTGMRGSSADESHAVDFPRSAL